MAYQTAQSAIAASVRHFGLRKTLSITTTPADEGAAHQTLEKLAESEVEDNSNGWSRIFSGRDERGRRWRVLLIFTDWMGR